MGKAGTRVQIARAILATQSAGVGCGGLLAAVLAVVSLLTGIQWARFALASVGVAMVLLISTAFLVLLAVKLGKPSTRWRMAALATEALLIPIGVPVIAWVGSYQPGTPQNPGTDGPFADGGQGLIGLTAFAFTFGGALTVGLLLWDQASRLIRARRAARTG